MADLHARYRAIVARELGVSSEQCTPEARLNHDLRADALDTLSLVMAMEDEFGIAVSDDEVEALVTIADGLALLERHLAARGVTQNLTQNQDEAA